MSGEYLNHVVGVRLRVTGSGNLKTSLVSYDSTKFQNLADIPMSSQTHIQPTVLANFVDQKASLEIKTTEIDETFNISHVVVFVKPIATSYPM